MSTSEEAALNVADPQQTPQEEFPTEPVGTPDSPVSETQETRPVDDDITQTALRGIDGPQDDNLFLATAHGPFASLPPVNIVSCFTPRS